MLLVDVRCYCFSNVSFLNVIILSLCKSMFLFLGNNMLKGLGVKSHGICIFFLSGSEKNVYV